MTWPIRHQLDVGLVGAVFVVCVPALAAYGPFGSWPAIVLAALLPWAPVGLAALLVIVAVQRRRIPAALTALALLVHAALLAPLAVGTEPGASAPVVVMTANLRFGLADAERLVERVRASRVDVLGLQELTPEAVRSLHAAGLDAVLPYSLIDSATSSAGTGLWAARPLTRAPAWPSRNRSTAGAITIGGHEAIVQVLHPVPPDPLRGSAWHRDYALLRSAARDDPLADRTVLLGDMNASVHHAELRGLMGRQWRDAGEVAGSGMVRTWSPVPSMPALFDLDHVLVPTGVRVGDVDVVRVSGSDHRGVVAELVLAP